MQNYTPYLCGCPSSPPPASALESILSACLRRTERCRAPPAAWLRRRRVRTPAHRARVAGQAGARKRAALCARPAPRLCAGQYCARTLPSHIFASGNVSDAPTLRAARVGRGRRAQTPARLPRARTSRRESVSCIHASCVTRSRISESTNLGPIEEAKACGRRRGACAWPHAQHEARYADATSVTRR